MNNDQGNTMVETLVAFTVLLIVLAILYQMVAFCSSLRMKAADEAQVVSEFNQELYRKGNGTGVYDKITKTSYSCSSLETAKGPYLYLTVDESKTDTKNHYTSGARRIKLDSIGMDCYSYKEDDPLITTNEIAVPKAVQFHHRDEGED